MIPNNFPGATLITGANGGIGRHLLEFFLGQGAWNPKWKK